MRKTVNGRHYYTILVVSALSACDGRTDRQTDRRTDTSLMSRMCIVDARQNINIAIHSSDSTVKEMAQCCSTADQQTGAMQNIFGLKKAYGKQFVNVSFECLICLSDI